MAIEHLFPLDLQLLARDCEHNHWFPVQSKLEPSNQQENTFQILSLQAYTCYLFRYKQHYLICQNILTVLFSYAICDIQSADSQQVWTLPSGEHGVLCTYHLSIFSPGSPGSPPHILSVRQLPRLHINITFEPPEQKNGKM